MAFQKPTKGKDKKVEDLIDIRERIKKKFTPSVELEKRKSLIVAYFGDSGVGKTYYSLTAPGKIFVIDFENKAKDVVKFFDEEVQKRVNIDNFLSYIKNEFNDIGSITFKSEFERVIDELLEYSEECPDEKCTIVIDTTSEIWSKLQNWLIEQNEHVVALNAKGKPYQYEFGHINKIMSEAIDKLRLTNYNVVLIGQAKSVYEDNKPTSMNEGRWYQGIKFLADISGEIKIVNGKKYLVVHKCTLADGLIGQMIEDPTFENIAKFIEEKSKIKFEFLENK